MSPKQVKITPGSLASAMPSSTRPIGITHTGQPGPCTSSTFAGQQVVDAVLVDRVRVAAADLHHLVVAAGLDRGEDLARHRAAQLGVAELVDEPHAGDLQPRDRGPRVHEQRRRRAPRPPGRSRPWRARRPRLRTGRATRPSSTLSTRISTPRSPHVMQWPAGSRQEPRASGIRTRASFDHARLQLLELLLVVRAHLLSSWCVASASSSSILERAKPTWIRTQSPGSARRRRTRCPGGRC